MFNKINLKFHSGQVFFIFTLSLFLCAFLQGEIQVADFYKLKVKDCLLPKHHPLQASLKGLFKDPRMFESPGNFKQAGFDVVERMRRGFMVAGHPALEGYLIKKFQNHIPQIKQLDNYLARINGARTLRDFIKLNDLKYIVVSNKWLYKLPKQFSHPKTGHSTYVLIVEKFDLCSGGKDFNGEVAKKYYNMDFDILRELCIVLYYFKGLDSGPLNMPFTKDNKIAFVDTESWNGPEREGFVRVARKYMRQDHQEYILQVYKELKKQDRR